MSLARALLFSTSLVAAAAVSASSAAPARADASPETVERARALFLDGQRAYDEGRFAVAAKKMREAFLLTKSPELAFNLARTYERMGEYDAAVRYFGIYLERGKPDETERAAIAARIESIKAAKARQREQLFAAPASEDELTAEAREFFSRGIAMFRARHYEAAMQAFIAAHRFAPLPPVLFNLAVTAERMGAKRDAVDYYREYLLRWPEAPDRAHVERKIAALRER